MPLDYTTSVVVEVFEMAEPAKDCSDETLLSSRER